MKVRIVEVPQGEAPLEIRKSWVGIELPLAKEGLQNCRTVGVVSGPKTILGQLWKLLSGNTQGEIGYLVEGCVAINLLNESNPDAAKWWSENTHFEKQGKYLFFNEKVCHVISNS
ncbi:hypothetical protein [Microbulbifer sp. VAAF005]|uniref:hypothetical protein n=1 Tax=Microbulbifer sp. VAAF005 TaxID=3034230 RepID=UPI0024AD8C37|nr:hypothetical protein [Microbulbifer sp. VAAF005]WHI46103.1 hypothetical protein P0078_20655 [Microbulbifer sp. VAAF005]